MVALAQEAVITRILQHLKLASIPLPSRACSYWPSNTQLGRLSSRRRVRGYDTAQRR